MKAMSESEIKRMRSLVNYYVRKGEKNFDDCLSAIETEEERSAAWNAIQKLDKILQGFDEDILDMLVEKSAGKEPKERGVAITPIGKQIRLRISETMGWGANLNIHRIFDKFNHEVCKPLTSLLTLLRVGDSNEKKDLFAIAEFAINIGELL